MKAGKETGSNLRVKNGKVRVVDPKECAKVVSEAIARRAYEIYKARGAAAGQDREDWQLAEREIVQPLSCGVLRLENGVDVATDVSTLKANEIEVCVEPHALSIIGKRVPTAGSGTRPLSCRKITFLEELDSSSVRVRRKGSILEIQASWLRPQTALPRTLRPAA